MSLERAYIKVIFPGQIREGIPLIKTNTLGFEPGNRCQEPRMGWGEKATDSVPTENRTRLRKTSTDSGSSVPIIIGAESRNDRTGETRKPLPQRTKQYQKNPS